LIPATSPPRALLRVDRPVCDLHHGYWRKTDQNPAEWNHFAETAKRSWNTRGV